MESQGYERPYSSGLCLYDGHGVYRICHKWRYLFSCAKSSSTNRRWAVTAQDKLDLESSHVRMEENLQWWTSLLLILSAIGKPTSKILVPECGDSQMINKLHDSGYSNLSRIRSSDMIREMIHLVCRPSFAWRNLDIFNDTLKLGDEGYDFVVDNGVLLSLGSSITKYLFKVVELLKCGGNFIVFLFWNACDAAKDKLLSCLRSLLDFFPKGWKITFYKVSETTLGFNVVLQKTPFDYTSWITGYEFLQDVEPNLYEVLKDDQDRKRENCIGVAWKYNDVLNGAVGDISSLSIGRGFCFGWTHTWRQIDFSYRAIVLDVIPPVEKYALDVFLVPKFLLDDILAALTIKEHQDILRPLTRKLAQWNNGECRMQKVDRECRYVRVLKEELLTPLERKDDGDVNEFATEDVMGFNVTSPDIPSTSADQGSASFINEDEGKNDRSDSMPAAHEKQCLAVLNDGEANEFATGDMMGFNVTSPDILSVSADQGTISSINEDEGKPDRSDAMPAAHEKQCSGELNDCEADEFAIPGDMTGFNVTSPAIPGVFADKGTTSDAMPEEHEKQCSPQLKASPSRSTITYIPATKVILIQHEYQTSLTDWLADNPVRWSKKHDNWNNSDLRLRCKVHKVPRWNSSRPTQECGWVISGLITAVCNLHTKGKSHGDLRNPDNFLMSYVDRKIGVTTEKAVDVYLRPCEGSDQGKESMKKDYNDLIYLIFDRILQGHELPRLWDDLNAAMSFIARRLEVITDKELPGHRRYLGNHPACWRWNRRFEFYEHIWMEEHQWKSLYRGDVVNIAKHTDIGVTDWTDCVPVGTPLERVLHSGSYTSDKKDLYKYLRTVEMHLYETQSWAGFVIKGDDNLWLESMFVEVVLSECFPNHLNKMYEEMEILGIRI